MHIKSHKPARMQHFYKVASHEWHAHGVYVISLTSMASRTIRNREQKWQHRLAQS